ncbi:hypothetical protein PR202_ga24818 [Eleusine coracana subsp. coracana]|uniref:RING-type domain-containing protein n=1 Tax=Eleusine coracana subsp. coracana TaxID=191504 RepID=A0AAV5D8Q1_ELECO|nr:hypothetical protein QOZ80_9AG0674180 [Eleusine coracana subsp. coracana]GJN07029.1 hypothetical protein PR202_ga24818 [Eleusine coracana subsp. coracana]
MELMRSRAAADDEDTRIQHDEARVMEARRIRELWAEMQRFWLRSKAAIIMREARARENRCFRGVSASDKAILALREPNLDKPAAAAGQDCPVCFEDVKEGDMLRVMPCSHCFHMSCIYKWLRASGMCPCCRFKLPSEDEQHIYMMQLIG